LMLQFVLFYERNHFQMSFDFDKAHMSMIIAALNRFQSIIQGCTTTKMNKDESCTNSTLLHSLGCNFVLGSSDWLGLGWGNLVQLHESGEIELWLLEDLDLSDHAVILEWEDFRSISLNLLSNFFFN